MRVIRLLDGDSAASNEVGQEGANRFALYLRNGGVDVVTLDAERWLEGATLASVASDGSEISVSVASPKATLTITASSSSDDRRLTLTGSDGRKRVIEMRLRVVAGDEVFDYED